MTTEETISNNKYINAFMGYPYNMTEDGYSAQVMYHKSFDWLIPVVEKITNIGYCFSLEKGFPELGKWRCKIYGTSKSCSFTSDRLENPLEATYSTVIQFINWYNQNNK